MDGDGRTDVVALSALDGTLGVLANRASTTNGASGSIGVLRDAEVQGYARSGDALKLADIDGDGALDAVFVRRTDKGTVLYAFFGDGHGKLFQRAEVLPEPTGTSSGDLVIADFDALDAAAVRRSVVAHEVAHLRHMNHSPDFYAWLDHLFEGDRKSADRWLKAHGRGLYLVGQAS